MSVAADQRAMEMRVERANAALDAYRAVAGDDEPLSTLGDMLADLQHWADAYGVDFARAMEQAVDHYDEERVR